MKTFKLVTLEILEKDDDELITKEIPLIDGLIIDNEVDRNRWLIEALISKEFESYFIDKMKQKKDMVLQVRITKEANPKATVVAKVIDVNEIEDDINIILKGNIVNRAREQTENLLQQLIEAGYKGEALLMKFKEKNRESLF